ncbi:MAG: NDP-sugar synthase [Acidimicrobiales bacterium]|nr:NDP-sugar synthase [Acidimicrobiales bacterium]
MKAIVLVGGEGTRLRPLTLRTPKQMLPVGGRPMLERVVHWLAGHGVDEAILSLGYRPDAFLEAYPGGVCAGVALKYVVEDSPLDTAGAIGYAARTASLTDPFLVVNGDVLTELDVTSLVRFHRDRSAEATIALTPVDDPSRFGVVPTDETGRVVAFIEKPRPEEAPTNLINAGTYVLEPSVVDRIPEGRRVSIERETFPQMVAEGRLFAMASDAAWLDAGTPATYLAANLDYADDGVVLGAGVFVDEAATVCGSVIMDGAQIEAGAEVRDSIVGQKARIGRGCRILDLTVVGEGFVVEPGTVVSGGRLPG